jgi:hypothetical protein
MAKRNLGNKLNNWSVMGGICFCIGILLLLVGAALGFAAASAISPLAYLGSPNYAQLQQTIFMATATPYLVGAGVMLIVGVVGMLAGNAKPEEKSLQPPKVHGLPLVGENAPLPPPRMAKCPSCGQEMIFVTEHQRWYCPNEKKYI